MKKATFSILFLLSALYVQAQEVTEKILKMLFW